MVLMVEKAQEADIQRLLDIMYAAFRDSWDRIMFPEIPVPEARGASVERWRNEISKDPAMRFMKAVDTDVGQIIALARWNVYEVKRPEREWKTTGARDWDTGTNVEAANEFINAVVAKRQKTMGGNPHCCLNMLVCDPKYQRRGVSYAFGAVLPYRGRLLHTQVSSLKRHADSEFIKAGRMLLHWGLKMADGLGLEVYLEASSEGHHLYQSAGFKDIETLDIDMSKYGGHGIHQHFVMTRPAQSIPNS